VALVALVALFASRVLMAQNRQLEELQRQKDTLVNTLVHDLRQPLTAVIGGLHGVAEMGNLPEDGTRELVGIAQEGASTLLQMVNDLLDVARVEADAPLIQTARIPPHAFIAPPAELLQPLARRRGVALQVALPPELPEVIGDAERLRRVMSNLLGNALKFTQEGGSVVVAARLDEPAHALAVSVSDTGLGIPAAEQTRIFDKFACGARNDGGRTSTGLGLYFCKLIIEAHGGNISVQSEPGQGATFTFSLPLAPAQVGAAATAS
jgi:signal transduction histidine kinase